MKMQVLLICAVLVGPYCSDFDELINSVGSDPTTLVIDREMEMSNNVVVPSSVTLVLDHGGKLKQNGFELVLHGESHFRGGVIENNGGLIIYGKVVAGPYHIFVQPNSHIQWYGANKDIWVQWYGADDTMTATINTDAIQRALDDIKSEAGMTLHLSGGTFKIEDELSIVDKENFTIDGHDSWIEQTVNSKNSLRLEECEKFEIRDLQVVSNFAEQFTKGIYLKLTSRGLVKDVFFRGHYYGLFVEGGILNVYENISGGANILKSTIMTEGYPFQKYGIYMIKHVGTNTDCTYSTILNPIVEGGVDSLAGIYIEDGYAVQIIGGTSEAWGWGYPNRYGLYLKDCKNCMVMGLDNEKNGNEITPNVVLDGGRDNTFINVHQTYLHLTGGTEWNTLIRTETVFVIVDAGSDYNTFDGLLFNQNGGSWTNEFADNGSYNNFSNVRSGELGNLAAGYNYTYTGGSVVTRYNNHNSGTVVFDCKMGRIHKVTMVSDTTSLSLVNCQAGEEMKFIFQQDAIGGRTVSGWSGYYKWSGGTAFTPSSLPSSSSTLELIRDSSGVWHEMNRSHNQ